MDNTKNQFDYLSYQNEKSIKSMIKNGTSNLFRNFTFH